MKETHHLIKFKKELFLGPIHVFGVVDENEDCEEHLKPVLLFLCAYFLKK